MRKNELFLLNLQLFAEGDGGEGAGAEGNGAGAEGNNGAMDLDGFLKDPKNQAEFDKRVAKALETQKSKLEAQYKAQAEADADEAAKLAKMNAEQKEAYEKDKMQKELEALKSKIARGELRTEASKMLKESEIDATSDILDLVVGADAETTKANVEKFVDIVQKAIKANDVKRATGSTPKSYGGENEELTEIQKRIAKYKK